MDICYWEKMGVRAQQTCPILLERKIPMSCLNPTLVKISVLTHVHLPSNDLTIIFIIVASFVYVIMEG